MDSEAHVELALDVLSCSQKDLASHLGVSPTQISKWKKGEHMSLDMAQKIRDLVKIGDEDPRFILSAGSIKEASKWKRLIDYLAMLAEENAETGYNTYPLTNDTGTLYSSTFDVLRNIGVEIPKEFPKDLDVCYHGDEDSDDDEIGALVDGNPYSSIIYQIYESLNDVYGFYAAYISHLMFDEELELFATPACNIEPCLMSLAACKIEVDLNFAPKVKEFRRHVKKDYEEWLAIVKDKAFRAGVPLRAELLDMVYRSAGELGHDAEAESLGFNSSRLHPDVYMNELLVGMRIIHQVLPVIMKKLGIDEEFTLDETGLRIT